MCIVAKELLINIKDIQKCCANDLKVLIGKQYVSFTVKQESNKNWLFDQETFVKWLLIVKIISMLI